MARKDAQGVTESENSGLIWQGGMNLKWDSDLTRIMKPLVAKKRGSVSVREGETDIKRKRECLHVKVFQ